MANVQEVTDSTFQAEVLDAGKPVVVDFWAAWCMPCRMMSPILEEVAKRNADTIKVVKMNTDENQATAGRYNIMSIPTLALFRNGKEVGRVIGVRTADALQGELDKAFGKQV